MTVSISQQMGRSCSQWAICSTLVGVPFALVSGAKRPNNSNSYCHHHLSALLQAAFEDFVETSIGSECSSLIIGWCEKTWDVKDWF